MQTTKVPRITMEAGQRVQAPRPRIALLTPYTGGNLGDGAIQDSVITNLRQRMPEAQFTGITLSCDNFVTRHGGASAFPLLSATPLYSASERNSAKNPPATRQSIAEDRATVSNGWKKPLKRALRIVPGLVPAVKKTRSFVAAIRREISHSSEGYRFLRGHDLLLVSGGGQLDDEWGGPWELPLALCKWTLLARLARVPCAMASVGAGKIASRASRMFFSTALRVCCYRSYRETKTKAIAAGLLSRAANDPVVPDLAFSLPDSEFPSRVEAPTTAHDKPVVALSPIAFGKPGNWPTSDSAVHERYVRQFTQLFSCLLRQGYFLIVACSSMGDDESVVNEILANLDDDTKPRLESQTHFPKVKNWKELVAVLSAADYLIASRLHGTILGFLTQTPVIAISFDPKVDWVMEDLCQTDCLLHIQDFTADQVLDALDRIKTRRGAVVDRIISYRREVLPALAAQYDSLAALALAHHSSN